MFQVDPCTKGTITSTIISDDSFPVGYDELQFRNCLNATVVRDNLASLCEKIDDSAFQRIILDKLNEVICHILRSDQIIQDIQDSFNVYELLLSIRYHQMAFQRIRSWC